jgi:hypothetical protein
MEDTCRCVNHRNIRRPGLEMGKCPEYYEDALGRYDARF